MPICTQGMQRTWWPEAGTIIVTGPYCQGNLEFLSWNIIEKSLKFFDARLWEPWISLVLYMTVLYWESAVFLIIKLRHLWDCLTIIMGSPILSLYIQMGPCWCHRWQCVNILNNILNKYGHSGKKHVLTVELSLSRNDHICVWDIVSFINTLPHV